jgi:hypothetical protein
MFSFPPPAPSVSKPESTTHTDTTSNDDDDSSPIEYHIKKELPAWTVVLDDVENPLWIIRRAVMGSRRELMHDLLLHERRFLCGTAFHPEPYATVSTAIDRADDAELFWMFISIMVQLCRYDFEFHSGFPDMCLRRPPFDVWTDEQRSDLIRYLDRMLQALGYMLSTDDRSNNLMHDMMVVVELVMRTCDTTAMRAACAAVRSEISTQKASLKNSSKRRSKFNVASAAAVASSLRL